MEGEVKYVNEEKGFGFISVEGERDDYFFHRSGCEGGVWDALTKGTKVDFEPSRSDKGLRAEGVRGVAAW